MLQTAMVADNPKVDPIFQDGVRYEAICYPAGSPSGDWSLRNLQKPDDVDRHPQDAERLGRVLAKHGIKRAYAPRVADSSALIVPRSALSDVLELPHGVTLFRNQDDPKCTGDGVALGRGDAFVMSGGGCPVVVAVGDGMCIVAHASRDSLLDRHFILTGKQLRKYKSVVNAIVGYAARRGGGPLPPQRMWLYWHFVVPPSCFDHPPTDEKWGALNHARHQYVEREFGPDISTGPNYCLHVGRLIEAQARKACFKEVVPGEEIPEDGPFGHTRHPNEVMRTVRSLNIVHRMS